MSFSMKFHILSVSPNFECKIALSAVGTSRARGRELEIEPSKSLYDSMYEGPHWAITAG